MKKEYSEELVMRAVARLQEFYGNESLHIFFHQCEEYEVDVVSAFVMLDEMVMQSMRASGEPPELNAAAEKLLASFAGQCASSQGLCG
jgi:hypothetical protein